MKNFKIIIKLIIVFLLFGCLYKMPYGYYQFVRIVTFLGFIGIAYIEYESKRKITIILALLIAILFNPIAKIYFKKDTWQTIDEAIAGVLVIWIIIDLLQLYIAKRGMKNRN